MFKRILIANRGEIARRIQATCRIMGVETVAVYSDADRTAGFVRNADQAVHIGPAPATESYLRQTRIIDAARATGAQAIHPGYGFLAENTRFARAVSEAGLTFIGPPASTMALMGSKVEAKLAMEAAGIPCVPGYHGSEQDDQTLADHAQRIGYPVLIKASAGGGGKGMRVVHAPAQLATAAEAARREANSAFGDATLLLEKFIERPRHIEVQVFGDQHGTVLHLHERECSVQRRYQKIIEEAPSPSLDAAQRARITATAVKAARAVNYHNAGTIEFIVTPDGEFYFMEMNTRLQVEHPVTEMVTGVDLVAWQLLVACGEPLPLAQADIPLRGHAIEARIYAEDPYKDFMPSSGRLTTVAFARAQAPRIDADIGTGDSVSPYYDPMIAKVSVHRDCRARTVAALSAVLEHTSILGPATNLPLLRRLLRHSDFLDARIDTAYLDRQLDSVLPPAQPAPLPVVAAAAAAALVEHLHSTRPWAPDGWQLNAMGRRRWAYMQADGLRVECMLEHTDDGLEARREEQNCRILGVQQDDGEGIAVDLEHAGIRRAARVTPFAGGVRVNLDGVGTELVPAPLYPVVRDGASGADHPGAPMPGRVVKVLVAQGDEVRKGQGLVVLEGMKMELTVAAAIDGIVERLLCAPGDQVEADAVLVDLSHAVAPSEDTDK